MKGSNNFKGKFSPFIICSNGLHGCASSLFSAVIFCEMERGEKTGWSCPLREKFLWCFLVCFCCGGVFLLLLLNKR